MPGASARAGPSFLVGVGLFILVAAAAVGTTADADLWGHLTFGRDIVTSRHVIDVDGYSFTSNKPWVNHEWLAEVALFEVYRLGGSSGLILFKFGIIASLMALIWRQARRAGARPVARAAIVLLAFAGTYWRTHTVRPQLFSVLLFAMLLWCIVGAGAGHRKRLWAVPLLMTLWANLHGGFIVGLGVFGCWAAAQLFDPRCSGRDRVAAAFAGLAAGLATLVNPYGWRLWTFLAETVRLDRGDIEDWGSILTHPVTLGVPWLLVAIAALIAVWRSGFPRRIDFLVLTLGLGVASCRVSRLDAFFALAVVMLLAPQLVHAWSSLADREGAEAAPGEAPAFGAMAITAIALGTMAIPAARFVIPYATCLSIGGAWAPDAAALRFIEVNHLTGRMLTWFDWGEYAIWHFGPALQVSIDGRRETVYSDETIQAHRRFYAADATAVPYLRALNPDYIWVPNRIPIAHGLAETSWTRVFQGPMSSVFARSGAASYRQVAEPFISRRCFPGP